MDDKTAQDMALLITVNCVRNTIIEDYHADGKLSQDEMKRFNKEVVNKIYTFIKYWFTDSKQDFRALMDAVSVFYPSEWDRPELDEDFIKAIDIIKKRYSA